MDKEVLEREVKEIADAWKGKEGNLIMVLHQIQNRYGLMVLFAFKGSPRLRGVSRRSPKG